MIKAKGINFQIIVNCIIFDINPCEMVVEGFKQIFKDGFETKKNSFASKEDLANAKSDILRWTFAFVFGALLLNIIAIIGAVISVAHLISK